jgi:hypothetical protein
MEEYVVDKKIANDPVHHPSHYETGKFECIEVMEEALGRDAVEGFCLCNAFKYIYRSQRKNGAEDLEKALWYLNKLLNMKKEDPISLEVSEAVRALEPLSAQEILDKLNEYANLKEEYYKVFMEYRCLKDEYEKVTGIRRE